MRGLTQLSVLGILIIVFFFFGFPDLSSGYHPTWQGENTNEMKGHNDAKMKLSLIRSQICPQQKPSPYPTTPSAVKTEDLCQDMHFMKGQAHNSNQAAHIDLYLTHKSILMVATQEWRKHWKS